MRQQCDTETLINVDEMKKTMDVVDYDAIHLQKYEEDDLNKELKAKLAMNACEYCKEKSNQIERYEDEIEEKKGRECLKALEREKIANGMKCTKIDELELRKIQKMQIQEKKYIEQTQAEVDVLWHQVLINEVRSKEEKERAEAERLKREMIERRMAYDEQIQSANRKRQELLQSEREVENRRLNKMKKRMEQDYYDAIKKKKDQQMVNKHNFIEGHQIKLSRIKNEKRNERELDISAIQVAMNELRRENQMKLYQIHELKREKDIFVENYNRERMMADELEKQANKITSEWKEKGEKIKDEFSYRNEAEKQSNKLKAVQEYKRYIERTRHKLETKRLERKSIMDRVKKTAYNEICNKLDSANEELRRQIDYRNALTNQIRDNQKIMELELNGIERKQRPFTKKAIMFKEAMEDKVSHLSTSENPVHPFKKIVQRHRVDNTIPSLPFIK